MKVFLILSLSILFLQCKKEEKLSDGITFQYDKSLPMKYQEFDEGYGNMGGRILYYGHKPSKIPIKYYFSGIAPPPAPPYAKQDYKPTRKSLQRDSLIEKYFKGHLDFDMDYKNTKYDSLNNKSFIVEARHKDTIPQYAIPLEENIIKSYYSFPVIIKNISTRDLRLNDYSMSITYEVLNYNKKWQIIFNYDTTESCCFCGEAGPGFLFKKEAYMIMSIPYLHGKFKTKMRIRFGYAFSNEFDASINPEIFKKQHEDIFIK
ncbi:hypothetical protein CMU25_08500 [Elizabethkingia anophelis]|nr:hypothetical protein [Elizabethkingia anophelis]MDV3768883.1 hypothetical protein [Elizabethkingia anophelis]MDV3776773.1 hypothetical protein [Elizabethkingia anophelis]MDV3840379.1 hypothetical protein [Elizabethkingia anophelis]